MRSSRSSIAALALPPLLALAAAGAVFAEHLKEERDRRARAEAVTGGNVELPAGRG